jgi:hypothetical protein
LRDRPMREAPPTVSACRPRVSPSLAGWLRSSGYASQRDSPPSPWPYRHVRRLLRGLRAPARQPPR